MKAVAVLRAVAGVAAAIILAGCGSGGVGPSGGSSGARVGRPVAPPTPSTLMDGCSGERYARRHLPSEYTRVLRKADWKYFGSWARVGQVAVVNVVYAETADSHERAVVFIRGDKLIGADAASPKESRFDARICSVGRASAVTGYWYRVGATGADRSCPEPRPAFATVRWRVTAEAATPLDHIPGHCK